MSRKAAAFTQADVARALRAAEQVKPGALMVEITRDGSIRILPAPPAPVVDRTDPEPPLDTHADIVL